MKAAVFEKEGSFVIKDMPKPRIERGDQVLVKVEACSICGTDVHITETPPAFAATPGTILGHEFCGRVVEVGAAVTHLAIGDRVVANPNNYCGCCAYCRKNMPNACEHLEALGIDYDGAFAEYCVISGKVAYKISEQVPMEIAACVEPLACAVNGLKKVSVRPGDSAVVVGGGPIGLIIAMLLKASGVSTLFLLETAPFRADFARKLDPTWRVLNPRTDDVKAEVLKATDIGADVVFDVTGSQLVPCIGFARKGGSVVLFGINARAHSDLKQIEITNNEIAVMGTWLANATFPDAVRIVEQNIIDVRALITDVIPLEGIHEGLKKLAAGQAVKVVVKM